MGSLILSVNADAFTGSGDELDVILGTPATLGSADTLIGGGGVDALFLTAGGSVASAAFLNVSGFEQLILSDAGNSVVLRNELVSSSSFGHFDVLDGAGNDLIDLSLVTTLSVSTYVYLSGGDDRVIGGSGPTHVLTAAAALSSADTIDGGGGMVDQFIITDGGTASAAAMSGVTNFEYLSLRNGGAISLTNANFGGSFVFGLGTDANDTFDASAVSGSRGIVTHAEGGDDTLIGGAGVDRFVLTGDQLTSGDSIDGGGGYDYLDIAGSGNVSAADLANVQGIEAVIVRGGVDLTLADGITGEATLAVYDANGSNRVDATGMTTGVNVVELDGGGNDTFLGGAGADALITSSANLNSADTFDGNGGFDQLIITDAANVTSGALGGVSDIEYVVLQQGGSVQLRNGLADLTRGYLYAVGTGAADTIDGSAVTDTQLTFHGNGGADSLTGGSQRDAFVVGDDAFARIDGLDSTATSLNTLILRDAGQSFNLTANSAKIANIQVIDLRVADGGEVLLTGADIPVISGGSNYLYVVGDADDSVSAGTGWSLISTGHTNSSIPGYTFVEYRHTNGSTLYIAADIPDSGGLSVNNAPTVLLGGLSGGGNFATSYTTGASAGAAIAAASAFLDDPDPAGLGSMIGQLKIKISNPLDVDDGEGLVLAAGVTLPAGLSVAGAGTATLTISGIASDSVYQTLLTAVRYVNPATGAAADLTTRLVSVEATDDLGAVSITRTATITLANGDVTPPAPPVLTSFSDNTGSPTDNVTSDATLVITGTAELGSTVIVRDGSTVVGTGVTDGSGTFTIALSGPLSDGEHSLTATATDPAGNVSGSSAPLIVVIDTEAPVIGAITTDVTGGSENATEAADGVAVTANVAGATGVLIGGVAAVEGPAGVWTATIPANAITDGPNTIAVSAMDAAGNVSTASTTFTADLSPPIAPTVSLVDDSGVAGDGKTNNAALIISPPAPGDTQTVSINGGVPTGAYSPPTADGSYTVTVTNTDPAGNASSTTISFVLDSTAPTLDLDASAGGNDFSASFVSGGSAIGLANAPAVVETGTGIASISIKLEMASGGADPVGSIDVSGLAPGWTVATMGGETVLTRSGIITAAEASAAIAALKYVNPSASDFTFDARDRVVTFTLKDVAGNPMAGATAQTKIAVAADVADDTEAQAFVGGDHDDTINTRGGSDTINAGAGHDTIVVELGGADRIDGGAGDDTVEITGGPGMATVTIEAGSGGVIISDSSSGGEVEILNVESLNLMLGGGSDDVFVMGDLAAQGLTALTIDAGDGDNTVDVSGVTGPAIEIRTGGGDDTVVLGASSETVVVGPAPGNGVDTIINFTAASDVLDLSGVDGLDVWDDFLAAAGQNGADVVVTLGSGSVTLIGVQVGDLNATNVIIN